MCERPSLYCSFAVSQTAGFTRLKKPFFKQPAPGSSIAGALYFIKRLQTQHLGSKTTSQQEAPCNCRRPCLTQPTADDKHPQNDTVHTSLQFSAGRGCMCPDPIRDTAINRQVRGSAAWRCRLFAQLPANPIKGGVLTAQFVMCGYRALIIGLLSQCDTASVQ